MSDRLLQIIADLLSSMPRRDGLRLKLSDDLRVRFVGEQSFEAWLDSPIMAGSVEEYRKKVERIVARYQEHVWDALQREYKRV